MKISRAINMLTMGLIKHGDINFESIVYDKKYDQIVLKEKCQFVRFIEIPDNPVPENEQIFPKPEFEPDSNDIEFLRTLGEE